MSPTKRRGKNHSRRAHDVLYCFNGHHSRIYVLLLAFAHFIVHHDLIYFYRGCEPQRQEKTYGNLSPYSLDDVIAVVKRPLTACVKPQIASEASAFEINSNLLKRFTSTENLFTLSERCTFVLFNSASIRWSEGVVDDDLGTLRVLTAPSLVRPLVQANNFSLNRIFFFLFFFSSLHTRHILKREISSAFSLLHSSRCTPPLFCDNVH